MFIVTSFMYTYIAGLDWNKLFPETADLFSQTKCKNYSNLKKILFGAFIALNQSLNKEIKLLNVKFYFIATYLPLEYIIFYLISEQICNYFP